MDLRWPGYLAGVDIHHESVQRWHQDPQAKGWTTAPARLIWTNELRISF